MEFEPLAQITSFSSVFYNLCRTLQSKNRPQFRLLLAFMFKNDLIS